MQYNKKIEKIVVGKNNTLKYTITIRSELNVTTRLVMTFWLSSSIRGMEFTYSQKTFFKKLSQLLLAAI